MDSLLTFGVRGIGVAALLAFIVGCGSSEIKAPNANPFVVTGTSGQSFELRNYSPLSFGLNQSGTDPNVLVPVTRVLQSFEYDAIFEPDLTLDKKNVNSFVTGMGFDIVGTDGNFLNFSFALEARQFDSQTGSFSTTTKIFSSEPGNNIENGQNFVNLNKNSPNYLLTGLGLRLNFARVSNLVIQRKSFDQIFNHGSPIDAGKIIELPAGWAVVGFILKIQPSDPKQTTPFIQDAVLYFGQLVSR